MSTVTQSAAAISDADDTQLSPAIKNPNDVVNL